LRILTLIILSIFLLIGCQPKETETISPVESNQYNYQYDIVEEAMNEASFDVSVPDTLPIPVAFVIYDHFEMEGHEYLDLSFYTNDNDLLTISVSTDQSLACPIDTITEQENQTVCFHDLAYVKHVSKEEGNLHYQIEYRHHESDEMAGPTKEQLISLLEYLTLS